MDSLLLVVAVSEVVPQWLDFPAALLRGFQVAEVLHSLWDVGIYVSVVDETPECPLNVFVAPDLDKRQGLVIWPRARCWFSFWHAGFSILQETQSCHWQQFGMNVQPSNVITFPVMQVTPVKFSIKIYWVSRCSVSLKKQDHNTLKEGRKYRCKIKLINKLIPWNTQRFWSFTCSDMTS